MFIPVPAVSKGGGLNTTICSPPAAWGLVKAYDGFDGSRGLCFSTYAVPVILGEIKKLFRDGGTVKVSRSLKELSLKISAVRERCVKETQGRNRLFHSWPNASM